MTPSPMAPRQLPPWRENNYPLTFIDRVTVHQLVGHNPALYHHFIEDDWAQSRKLTYNLKEVTKILGLYFDHPDLKCIMHATDLWEAFSWRKVGGDFLCAILYCHPLASIKENFTAHQLYQLLYDLNNGYNRCPHNLDFREPIPDSYDFKEPKAKTQAEPKAEPMPPPLPPPVPDCGVAAAIARMASPRPSHYAPTFDLED